MVSDPGYRPLVALRDMVLERHQAVTCPGALYNGEFSNIVHIARSNHSSKKADIMLRKQVCSMPEHRLKWATVLVWIREPKWARRKNRRVNLAKTNANVSILSSPLELPWYLLKAPS